MGAEAVAGDADHGRLFPQVVLEPGDLGLDVFHEGAVTGEEEHQHRAPHQGIGGGQPPEHLLEGAPVALALQQGLGQRRA